MSAIALLLHRMGHVVSGSELRESDVTRQLEAEGVTVHRRHSADHVVGTDLVAYSTAIPADHVELEAARDLGIAVRHRSGVLASICAVRRAVGVAGTHGKTTTTALLTHILGAEGLRPSAIIGAEVNGVGVGAVGGEGDLLVIEADESDGTLDVLPLWGLIVTNTDRDHLDYFGSFDAIQGAFLAATERAVGPVVLNADDPGSQPIVTAHRNRDLSATFGFSDVCSARIVGVDETPVGFRLRLDLFGEHVEADVPLRGRHNAENVAAALCMAHRLGVPAGRAAAAVADFPGVVRRFTERGDFNGALLIDDYAHLPAEIAAALSAAATHPRRTGRLVAVFQPNRYHRIAAMAGEYADCFGAADVVIITEIYASGTEPIPGVSGRMVADAITRAHPGASVVWAPRRDDVIADASRLLGPGDVCISMGCGDIESFPDEMRRGVG